MRSCFHTSCRCFSLDIVVLQEGFGCSKKDMRGCKRQAFFAFANSAELRLVP